MLRRMLDGGGISDGDLADGADTLAALGIAPERLREALERLARGDAGALQEILDTLDGMDRALQDAESLRGAREQVARARAGLGDRAAADPGTGAGGESLSAGDADDGPGGAGDPREEDGGAAGDPGGARPGTGRSAAGAREPGAPDAGAPTPPGPTLRAAGTLRDAGSAFVSEARALPRAGGGTLERVELDTRFAAQLEEVMSKDDYPVHYKEFIRRYFLRLSEGAVSEEQGP